MPILSEKANSCFAIIMLDIDNIDRNPPQEQFKPKEGLYNIAVSAIIENSKSKILTTKRSPAREHAPNEWELVTGRIDSGETSMEDSLQREIAEETGLTVNIIAPYRTFYFERGNDKKPHFGVNFYCKYDGSNDDVKLDMKEQDEYKWVAPEEALDLITDPNVKEAINKFIEFKHHYK